MYKSIKKKVNSNFFMKIIESFLGKGSFLILSLVFSYVCTKFYGAETFGVYVYAFTIVQIFMVFVKLGLDSGLMYSIPKNGYKHITLSFLVNLICSFLVILVFLFTIEDMYFKYMVPLIWFLSVEQLFFSIYRSVGKIKEYYYINGLLSMVLRILLVIILYYISGKNEYSIAIGVYISFFISVFIYFSQHSSKFKKLVFDKKYLLYSLPLVLSTMTGMLINRVDLLMIGKMLTFKEVGIYQIIVQISNITAVLLMIFNTVFAPEIAKLYHQGKQTELTNLYSKATKILALFSLILTIFIILFTPILLPIFGSDFILGEQALIIRSLGQFVNIAVGGVWWMLSMTGSPKYQLYVNLFALLLNFILNLFLIPQYGINGAAFSSMVTIIIANIIGYVLVSKKFGVKVFKFF
ncbi:oligosaccharide flippase family protein [Bacillus sp. Marseille-Q3570]|uniref:oligosaccharide flippase family protein n=1 Tax=Bacillus sp. Marseille-Q3570 TaxID=2963522 RepID=UPI0021B7CA75|nr:oligosaccharide flippase family protein [Bacillus sp. Marseille-Q3570]